MEKILAPVQWDPTCLGRQPKKVSNVTGHRQLICILSEHMMDCQLLPYIYTGTQNPMEGSVSNYIRGKKEEKDKKSNTDIFQNALEIHENQSSNTPCTFERLINGVMFKKIHIPSDLTAHSAADSW